MAQSNHERATANARAARKGGARRGAGRPLGSPDKVLRKNAHSEKDRFNALQFELGKALKEIERLRNELQYGAKFDGNAREMLVATMRGEYNPTQAALYSARVLYDKEKPAPDTEEKRTEGDENREWIINQLNKLECEAHREWDAELRGWIAAGKIHESCALLCRSQWADEPWESRQSADTAPKNFLQPAAQPAVIPVYNSVAPTAAPTVTSCFRRKAATCASTKCAYTAAAGAAAIHASVSDVHDACRQAVRSRQRRRACGGRGGRGRAAQPAGCSGQALGGYFIRRNASDINAV